MHVLLKLYTHDLRVHSKLLAVEHVSISDVAVTREDIAIARKVVFIDEGGATKVLKDCSPADARDCDWCVVERPKNLKRLGLDSQEYKDYLTFINEVRWLEGKPSQADVKVASVRDDPEFMAILIEAHHDIRSPDKWGKVIEAIDAKITTALGVPSYVMKPPADTPASFGDLVSHSD